ncbi:hypothetical protein G7Z17_g8537 [Cylindrodendrum hubeiense]|uniref:Uncharacterized protein n=1 Tax=Cylindrodendrum hubeiense TaxID=595255 RepID=A0A9P5H511_9HYPO|nr:hypothetical protein G7Z17_g8537 [Cylindrodendrum hubeiense]
MWQARRARQAVYTNRRRTPPERRDNDPSMATSAAIDDLCLVRGPFLCRPLAREPALLAPASAPGLKRPRFKAPPVDVPQTKAGIAKAGTASARMLNHLSPKGETDARLVVSSTGALPR